MRRTRNVDFSYAMGYEPKYEAWNLPYGIALLLAVAMLWGVLLVKERDLIVLISSSKNRYLALFGMLTGAVGILFWAGFPFNVMVTMFLVSWTHDAGGSLGVTIATGGWLVAGWWLAGWIYSTPNWNREVK